MTHIHPLACVDPTSRIDPSATVGAFSVIDPGVTIGPDVEIRPMCRIYSGTTIGTGCTIESGAMIGGTPQDRSFRGETSYCEIEEGTVIRESVTIHRGTGEASTTRIGKQCLLMANSHVGHNCVLENQVTLVNGALLGGYVHIGSQTTVSGNVAVHQYVRVGTGAMLGALAKITQDVVPFFIVDGPGMIVGVNRVGLRRMGVTGKDIESIQQAYRILCRENHSVPAAIAILKDLLDCPHIQAIVTFLSARTRRGFHLYAPSDGIPPAPQNRENCNKNINEIAGECDAVS